MTHTPDQVRRENGILWRSIWREIGVLHHRRAFGRVLVRELKKKQLIDGACGRAPSHWLVDAALLEAMRRVSGALQTDLEDFTTGGVCNSNTTAPTL